MNTPVLTTSAIYPVRLREDLPRDVAYAYWAGKHAEIVKRLPNLMEYNQYHFSATDRGYWPAAPTVGTVIPSSWPLDGLTEVRLPSMAAAFRVPLRMREVFLDEQNVFEHVLGRPCHCQSAQFKGSGKQLVLAHIDQVSTGQVPAEEATSQ